MEVADNLVTIGHRITNNHTSLWVGNSIIVVQIILSWFVVKNEEKEKYNPRIRVKNLEITETSEESNYDTINYNIQNNTLKCLKKLA